MLKKILIVLVACAVFQAALFFWLDRQADYVLNPHWRTDKVYKLNTDLAEAHSFNLSFNNRYLAYLSAGILEVVDLLQNKKIYSSEGSGGPNLGSPAVLAYQWLPDRNSLVFILRGIQQQNVVNALYTLDLENMLSAEAGSVEASLVRALNLPIQEISSIEISTYTNNAYLFYRSDGARQRLARIDIMKNINSLDREGEEIEAVSVSNKYGKVYVQRKDGGIYMLSGNARELVSDNTADILLGSFEDKVLVARVLNGQLLQIRSYSGQGGRIVPEPELFWQGEIPFQRPERVICTESRVILQSAQGVEVALAGGGSLRPELNNGDIPVVSPNGRLMMVINLNKKSLFGSDTTYTWHSLE